MDEVTVLRELTKYPVVRSRDYESFEHLRPHPPINTAASTHSAKGPAARPKQARAPAAAAPTSTAPASSESASAQAPGPEITIAIKPLKGSEVKVNLPCTASVAQLKKEVESKLSVPAAQQRIMFKGKPLADTATLVEAGLADESKVHLFSKAEDVSSSVSSTASPSVSASAAPSAKAGPTQDIVLALTRFLESQKTLTPSQIASAVRGFKNQAAQFVQKLSLDDVERLGGTFSG